MKKMKWILLAVAAFLLMLPAAQANGISIAGVEAERISVQLPESIKLASEPVIQQGKVSIVVDARRTNWTAVMSNAARSGGLACTVTLSAPAGDTFSMAARENFGAGDNETLDALAAGVVPDWFADDEPDLAISGSVDGAVIIADTPLSDDGVFIKPVSQDTAGVLVCWETEEHGRTYEYVQVAVSFTSNAAQKVNVPLVGMDVLSAVGREIPSDVTAVVEPGGITCIAQDFSDMQSLSLVLTPPEGVQVVQVTAPQSKKADKVMDLQVQRDGTAVLEITPDSHPTFGDASIAPAQLDYSLVFVGENGPEQCVIDCGMLTVWLLDEQKVPYPYYNKSGAQPADGGRLNIYHGSRLADTDALYDAEYGHVHLSKEGLDVTAAPSDKVRIEITAPTDAAYYAVKSSGGDFIYQSDAGLGMPDENDKKAVNGGESVVLYDQSLFELVSLAPANGDNSVLVYLQKSIYGRFGGYVSAVTWYTASGSVISTEYLSVTHGDFGREVRRPLRAEEELDAPVDEMTAIGRGGWKLFVRHDPQHGKNAVHYELQMKDDRDIVYELDGKTVFYAPYPEGGHCEDGREYVLYHYKDGEYGKQPERIVAKHTPYGLRFEVNSLSPFVLTWAADAAAAPVHNGSVPQTGDATPLALYACMMLMAAAAAAWMRRRMRV